MVGALFEVPIVINTRGQNINTIKLSLQFDPEKVSIVNTSGGTSIIGVWIETPVFDNVRGTEKMTGVITNGITTDYGVIINITFRALAAGNANIIISEDSEVLLNDGFGSSAKIETGRSQYTIIPRPPGGVKVYSLTHSIQDRWYNNNNPIFDWDKDPGVTGFSFLLDDKPNTIPDNTVITENPTHGYQKITDGISYFHIKAQKNGLWGETTHFQIRIDTEPPSKFKPEVNYIKSTDSPKAFVIFNTTDHLSGIDHYEVATISTDQPTQNTSIFIESQSPYIIPLQTNRNAQVIVRAIDKAGNSNDNYVTIQEPFFLSIFFREHIVLLLASMLLLLLSSIIIHYFITHKII
jgi:hypothetical protein